MFSLLNVGDFDTLLGDFPHLLPRVYIVYSFTPFTYKGLQRASYTPQEYDNGGSGSWEVQAPKCQMLQLETDGVVRTEHLGL